MGSDLVERLRVHALGCSNEDVMKQWDEIRAMIVKGDRSDLPRLCFESILDHFGEDAEQAAARIAELEAALSAEKAKVAEAVRELGMVADYVESHWQGAGLPLKADWIIREVSSWTTSYERNADELDAAREAAEAEAARLREAIHAVQDATAAYLPPDGIDAQECLNRILQATDNPTINAITLGAQYGRP